MRINFDQKLVNYRGDPIKGDDEKYLTVKEVCCLALTVARSNDNPQEWKIKFDMEKLAKTIWEGATTITSEDCVLIKKMVGSLYGPIVVGPICRILEGEEDAAKKKK